MPPLKGVSSAAEPAELLRLALEADSAEKRAALAKRGLALGTSDEPDTEFLLLRQLYLAHIESHRFREAVDVAARMAATQRMSDVAHHDMGRAWAALGDMARATECQRMAARSAVPDRRSFQYWALGNLLHQRGELEAALGALQKAERWSREDRPLIVAHQAWIRLSSGEAVPEVDRIVRELEGSSAGKGIGRLVLGMLSYELGDHDRARVHLRAFLRRNAAIDAAKAISLRDELRIARQTLAQLESD